MWWLNRYCRVGEGRGVGVVLGILKVVLGFAEELCPLLTP